MPTERVRICVHVTRRALSIQVNFLAISALLSFGSGYRKLLHKYVGRSAFETIAFGCMGLHMSHTLNADTMQEISLHDVRHARAAPHSI